MDENKKAGGPLSALGFRLIYFIFSSTPPAGRPAKEIAEPEVKVSEEIFFHDELLLPILYLNVKRNIKVWKINENLQFTENGR